MTTAGQLDIVNGPGKWDMMLAVFDGKPVYFQFEKRGEEFDKDPFEISGIHFYGKPRIWCGFNTYFPINPGGLGKVGVRGFLNLQTRKGRIETGRESGIPGLRFPEEMEKDLTGRITDPQRGSTVKVNIPVGKGEAEQIGTVIAITPPRLNPCPGLPDERIHVQVGGTVVSLDRSEITILKM